jgi:hypothetical protein
MDVIEYFRFKRRTCLRAIDENGTGSISIILICFLAGLVREYLVQRPMKVDTYKMRHRQYR